MVAVGRPYLAKQMCCTQFQEMFMEDMDREVSLQCRCEKSFWQLSSNTHAHNSIQHKTLFFFAAAANLELFLAYICVWMYAGHIDAG